jgi:hypothetical protein
LWGVFKEFRVSEHVCNKAWYFDLLHHFTHVGKSHYEILHGAVEWLVGLVNAGKVEDSNLDLPRLIVCVVFFSVYRKMSGLYYKMEHDHLISLSLQFIILPLGATKFRH